MGGHGGYDNQFWENIRNHTEKPEVKEYWVGFGAGIIAGLVIASAIWFLGGLI